LLPTMCSIGGANAKGAWSQVTSATSFQYEALQLDVMEDTSSGGGECFLVDVAVGAAGSELVIVSNILIDCERPLQGSFSIHLDLPIRIRSGARIAVRCQDIGGAGNRNVRVLLVGKNGGPNYPRAVGENTTTYGANTSTTNGTLVDSGATANTWGAWVQFSAATASVHNYLQAVIGNNQNTSGNSGGIIQVDHQIGIGASGSEQVVSQGQSGNAYNLGNFGAFAAVRPHIPIGTRLSMRTRSNSGAASDRQTTFIILAG
jgi:hypothetical protein